MILERGSLHGWLAGAKRVAPYLCMAVLFSLICLGLARSKPVGVRSFWDARIYASAIHDSLAGSDPYAPSRDGMDFVYPPLFLRAAAVLARVIPGGVAWLSYLVLLVLAACAIPWVLMTEFVRDEWFTPLMVCLLFVFQPELFAEEALISGNVATLLYAAILLAAIPGVRRNRWTLFYVTVAIAGLIKVPFLTLLTFSWLAGEGQFQRSAGAAFVVLFGYATEWLTDRRLFLNFLLSVKRQVIDESDAGLGVLAMFLKMGRRVSAMRGSGAAIACIATIAGMLAILYVLKRFRELPGVAALWVPAALVAAILSNPRMMSYDADIAIVPGIFLFLQWARSLPATSYRGVWIAIPPAIFLLVFRIGPGTAVFLLLSGSLLLVVFQIAAAARRAREAVPVGQPAQLQEAI